jgi:serine/threonine protein phosphatase PrpC
MSAFATSDPVPFSPTVESTPLMALYMDHEPLHGASISVDNRPLDKGEDYIFCQTYRPKTVAEFSMDEPCDILAVFDGHANPYIPATRKFMHHLKTAPLDKMLHKQYPISEIRMHFGALNASYDADSGATASIARIYPDRIECLNMGDSHTAIFIDGELVYMNRAHNSDNEEELARIQDIYGQSAGLCSTSKRQEVLSPDEITMVVCPRVFFPNGVQISPTQSLGHHDITGYSPAFERIPYSPEQTVNVLVFSDGVADVFSFDHPDDLVFLCNSTGAEVAAEAQRRWKTKVWTYVDEKHGIQPRSATWLSEREAILAVVPSGQTTFGNCDDVSVVSWCYSPPSSV